jgi:hypothetical protein
MRRALGVVWLVVALAMAMVGVRDTLVRARVAPYSPDEIINLDAALTLFGHGDYTSARFGGVPFDPSISSGIAVTGVEGFVLACGGTLASARAIHSLGVLALAGGVAIVVLRRFGLGLAMAAAVAASMAVAAQSILNHDLRLTHPGELTAVVYLAAGALLARRHPLAAAWIWGVALWWGKTLIAPGALALLAALLWRRAREGHQGLAAATLSPLAMFLAPLAIWVLGIALRYDVATAAQWCTTQLAFVAKHSTGRALSLGGDLLLPGWRFDPQWTARSFLRLPGPALIAATWPLFVGPLGVALWLSHRGACRDRAHGPDPAMSLAVLLAVGALALWFFAFDATQWGRHLLPAVYASLGLLVVAAGALWVGGSRVSRAGALALLGIMVAAAWSGAERSRAFESMHAWKPSYAGGCRGPQVLSLPCMQDEALVQLALVTAEACGPSSVALDQMCLRLHAQACLGRARELVALSPGIESDADTAAYMVSLLSYYAYREPGHFLDDLALAVCDQPGGASAGAYAFLGRIGIDQQALARRCDEPGLQRWREAPERTDPRWLKSRLPRS